MDQGGVEYTFPAIYHYAAEPYCAIGQVAPEKLTAYASAQHPCQVEKDLARMFGYPISHTRAVASFLGHRPRVPQAPAPRRWSTLPGSSAPRR